MRDRPAAFADPGRPIGSIENTGIAKIAVGAGEALGQLLFCHAHQRRQEVLPDGADGAFVVDHFIRDAGQGTIGKGRIVADTGLYLIPSFRRRFSTHAQSRFKFPPDA